MDINNFLINLITTIVAAFATAVFASWGIWRKEKAELEKEYSSRFNTKKWEVYTEFAELVYEIVGGESNNCTDLTKRPTEASLASQIMLIGSDKVVTAFRDWRGTRLAYGQAHIATKEKLFDLVAEMRRDLGNKYTRLNMGDLLGSLEPGS